MSNNPLKKILVYGDSKWSVGSVHKNIAECLKEDFEFVFYDWGDYSPESILPLLDNFDIIFCNLIVLKILKNRSINLHKFIFIAHGYPDIIGYDFDIRLTINDLPKEPIYAITSDSISNLYPKGIELHSLYNGVNLDDFDYKLSSHKLEKIGWCGAPAIKTKRFPWALEIAGKTNLLFSCAATMKKEDLKIWYQNIDVLLITAGPEDWMETGPLPAFEAIASNTLVIGTRVGNFSKLPGPKFDSIEEAIDILNRLKNNPQEIAFVKQEQYECVQKYWTYTSLKTQWKDNFLLSLKKSFSSVPKPLPKICFITAIYGNYESSCKPFTRQTINTDFICFTDNKNLVSNGWELDTTPYHLINKSPLDNDSFINSISNNNHSFNIGKYYKQAFQNIPRLQNYDTIVWIDGTIEIKYEETSEYLLNSIEKTNLITWHHEYRSGNLLQEVKESTLCGRYNTTFWFHQSQPYQDVEKQYNDYLEEGFIEDFYKNKNYHTNHMGVWVTCFIAFNNKEEKIKALLDLWYLQTLKYTTQDQIGFPFACQKMNITPFTLPNHQISGNFPHENTLFYKKHPHGD